MRYRLLGRTGLYVSEICLGTMTFGSQGLWKVMGSLGQQAVTEQVAQAYDAGVNFIDTANVYSLGESETLVGHALKALKLPRDQVIVATKSTGVMGEEPNRRGQSRHHIVNEVEASLRRLQLDHIDLYQLHGFDPLTPFDESLRALDDLVSAGKIRTLGICNMAAWQVMKTLAISDKRGWARFESVQAYYTIAGRDLERELVPLMQDQGLGCLVWSPLAGGLLSGKYKDDGSGPEGARRTQYDFPVVDKARAFKCVEAMRPIAATRGVSVAQIAIAWVLAKPWVTSVIIGAKTPEQLADNLAAASVTLTPDEVATLDAVSELPREYPGWMLALQGGYRAKPPERGPGTGNT